MATKNPTVEVTLEGKDNLSPKVAKAKSAFQGFKDFLKTSFALTLTDIASVVRGVANALGTVITASAESEAALNRTANAMRAAGTFTEKSLASVDAFAQALFKTTGIADETGLKLFTLARSYTTSNRAAAELAAAAADFSVASGKGLEESVTAIAGAMTGATKAVKKFVPEIANLTAEQLENGEATRLIAERFKGLAAGELQTLDGQVKLASESFGELVESFGKGLTGSAELQLALAKLNKTAGDGQTLGFFEKTGQAIRGFVGGVIELGTAISEAIGPFIEFGKTVAQYIPTFALASEAFEKVGVAVDFYAAKARARDAEAKKQLEFEKARQKFLATQQTELQKSIAAIDATKTAEDEKAAAGRRAAEAEEAHEKALKAAAKAQKEQTAAIKEHLKEELARLKAEEEAEKSFAKSEAALNRVTTAAKKTSAAYKEVTAAAAEAAAFTSGTFDQISNTQGIGAATSAAVAAGGQLVSGGRRVRIAGGGSRLTTLAPGQLGARKVR